jgi:hypothetical protein
MYGDFAVSGMEFIAIADGCNTQGLEERVIQLITEFIYDGG